MMVNADAIALARERRGILQKDLAELTGLSSSQVSKIESGLRLPTEDQIQRLADALNVPVEFFSQTLRRYSFGSSCTYHRKQTALPATELNRLLAEVNILRNHVEVLSSSLDITSQYQIPKYDVDDYAGDIKQIARMTREALRVPSGPIKNLVSVLESAGCIVKFMSFGTRKLDAISQWFPPTMPVFLVNADSPVDRQRFTMAHELGHLVAHESPNQEMEPQADAFASEFLMPSHEIKSMLYDLTPSSLYSLKLHWRVSMASIVRKAMDLNAISESRYRSLMVDLSKKGYRKREPDVLFPETSTLLESIIHLYEHELHYSPDDFAALLKETKDTIFRDYRVGQPNLSIA